MTYFITKVLVLTATAACLLKPNISRAAPPAECVAIPAPSRADIEPWLAGSAWSAALNAYVKGRYTPAVDLFDAAWKKVRSELESGFADAECNYDKVNGVLNRRVFKAPPDVVPVEDQFGLPLPVALAAADAACRSGLPRKAFDYLKPAADADMTTALAAAAVLESSWSTATARSRIGRADSGSGPAIAAALCYISTISGEADPDACATAAASVDDRQVIAIRSLLDQTRTGRDDRGTGGRE